MKTLSIAVPSYNMEKYLERCINSLICPSIDKLEIIIVNDGSKDKTSLVAHSLQAKYPESIVVVDKENAHQGSCINVAIKKATGKYFKSLDADDFFDTEVLERLINKLDMIDIDMIVHGHRIDHKNPISICPPENIGEGRLSNLDFQNIGLAQCIGMHGVAYKTEILQKNNIRLTEKCSYSDAEYCYYPMEFCTNVLIFPENLYLYQPIREGSESSLISEQTKESAYTISKRMTDDFCSVTNIDPTIKRNREIVLKRTVATYFANYLLHFSTNSVDNNRAKEMLEKLKKGAPDTYNYVRNITTRKIPFVKIFETFGITCKTLYHLMNVVHNARK